MVKLLFLCMVFFRIYWLVNGHELLDLHDSTPEDLPFQAIIQAGTSMCGGVLVTENYVLGPAYCVNGSPNATIYLGFGGLPKYISHRWEPNTQTLRSDKVYIHEDFAQFKNKHCLNNIALLKLSTPAALTKKVHPGKFISGQETRLLDGRFAQISGWFHSSDTNIKLATVLIRNQDTCSYLFGDNFFRSQEYCVKWSIKSRLNLLGNLVRVDNKIIGFQTNTPACAVANFSCSGSDMVLSFIPFLDWMSNKMNIPIEEFTVKDREERWNINDLTKIEDLTKKQIQTQKYGSDIIVKNLTVEIENVIAELRSVKSAQHNFVQALYEQIGSIKTEISNRKAGIDQNILQLQEELNGVRSEVRGGLIAQRISLNDTEAKLMEISENLQEKVFESIKKLENDIKGIKNTTGYIQIREYQRFSQHQQNMTNLREKLDGIYNSEIKARIELDKQVDHINNTIKNISSIQNTLQKDIDGIWEELTSNKGEKLHNMKKFQDEILSTVQKSKQDAHLHFDKIEKVLNEQSNELDKHIIQEDTQVHSLGSKIKSLNNSVYPILEYFNSQPYSN